MYRPVYREPPPPAVHLVFTQQEQPGLRPVLTVTEQKDGVDA